MINIHKKYVDENGEIQPLILKYYNSQKRKKELYLSKKQIYANMSNDSKNITINYGSCSFNDLSTKKIGLKSKILKILQINLIQ